MSLPPSPASKLTRRVASRAEIVARILLAFVRVRLSLTRVPLPEIVERLRDAPVRRRARHHPVRIGRLVVALLRVGPYRARCLVTSLVLFRVLREQGYRPEVVIGIPDEADSPLAHAWVEVEGHDVGPPPGRGMHRELLRLG